jgi:hypothetical protein
MANEKDQPAFGKVNVVGLGSIDAFTDMRAATPIRRATFDNPNNTRRICGRSHHYELITSNDIKLVHLINSISSFG